MADDPAARLSWRCERRSARGVKDDGGDVVAGSRRRAQSVLGAFRGDHAHPPALGRRGGDGRARARLGGRAGSSASASMAEDPALPHGPLELLMTVAEEVGLEGANALDGSMLTGSVLLNLDSEEDGRLTVGCAGSTDTWIHIERPRSS